MSFEGDLSNLALGDVLQTLAMSRQTGTFVVRGREERRLALGQKGVALLANRTSHGLRLGQLLCGTGKISTDDLDHALRVQKRKRDALLGHILAELGACSDDDVREARRYLASEELYDLFTWKEGKFEFLPGEPELTGLFADLWFDVAGLAMESARRTDETPLLLGVVPAGEVLRPAEGVAPDAPGLEAGSELRTIYDLADGTRTVEDLLDAFHRGRFDTWKALATLVEAGLLRPASAGEVVEAARIAAGQRDYARAARLFGRAAALLPGDDSVLQLAAETQRDAGDAAGAATRFTDLGRRRLEGGRPADAARAFRAAVALDAVEPTSRTGLVRSLAEAGSPDEAVVAAIDLANALIASGAYDAASRVAEAGLAVRADEPSLLSALANAHLGQGRREEALQLLDKAAHLLEGPAADRARLVEVYRRILQVDPARKDLERKIEVIESGARNRRRRYLRVAAAVATLLVVASVAVPMLGGPSVSARLDEAQRLLDERLPADAAEILDQIAGESLDEDAELRMTGLRARIAKLRGPKDAGPGRRKLSAELEAFYNDAARFVQEENPAEAFARLAAAAAAIEGPEGRRVQAVDAGGFQSLRGDWSREVNLAISNTEPVAQRALTRVTALRDRFVEDVWRKEDPEVLRALADASAAELEKTREAAWRPLAELVPRLAASAGSPKGTSAKDCIEIAGALVDAVVQLRSLHDRALARARRKEVHAGFVAAYAAGTRLEMVGRLEEAFAGYEDYLRTCEELRRAEPTELYAPIVQEQFGEKQMDSKIRARADRVAEVLAEQKESERAAASGDVERAFAIRRRLVTTHADIDFGTRFRLPLRIETRPEGAEVFALGDSPEGKLVGHTPITADIALAGATKFRVRLAGYRDCIVERKGVDGAESAVERIDLEKVARWASPAAGSTEAAPAWAGGWIYVAGRDGLVRRVSFADGAEVARFDARLLAGFSAAPVVHEGLVLAASLDGKTFLLDAATLGVRAAVDTGNVRVAPLVLPQGVLVVPEKGPLRLLDGKGATVWSQDVGRVRCAPADAGAGRALLVTEDGEAVLVDGASGRVLRRQRLAAEGGGWSTPAVAGPRAYVASDLGNVTSVDLSTLRASWTVHVEGGVRGRPVVVADRVVVCTGSGAVHVLDAATGAERAKALVGGLVDDGLADVGGGRFVVDTRRGRATCFDAECSLRWRFDAGDEVAAPPRLADGAVLLVTRRGSVIALDP